MVAGRGLQEHKRAPAHHAVSSSKGNYGGPLGMRALRSKPVDAWRRCLLPHSACDFHNATYEMGPRPTMRTSMRASGSVRELPQLYTGASVLAKLQTVTRRVLMRWPPRELRLLPRSCQTHSDGCPAVPQAKRCTPGRSLRCGHVAPHWTGEQSSRAGPEAQRLTLPAGVCHRPMWDSTKAHLPELAAREPRFRVSPARGAGGAQH